MEFIEKFELHKRYVFDKDIYIEYMLDAGLGYTGDNQAEEIWTDACNNKFVVVNNDRFACIKIDDCIYDIMPAWCREVPIIRVLTENDL